MLRIRKQVNENYVLAFMYLFFIFIYALFFDYKLYDDNWAAVLPFIPFVKEAAAYGSRVMSAIVIQIFTRTPFLVFNVINAVFLVYIYDSICSFAGVNKNNKKAILLQLLFFFCQVSSVSTGFVVGGITYLWTFAAGCFSLRSYKKHFILSILMMLFACNQEQIMILITIAYIYLYQKEKDRRDLLLFIIAAAYCVYAVFFSGNSNRENDIELNVCFYSKELDKFVTDASIMVKLFVTELTSSVYWETIFSSRSFISQIDQIKPFLFFSPYFIYLLYLNFKNKHVAGYFASLYLFSFSIFILFLWPETTSVITHYIDAYKIVPLQCILFSLVPIAAAVSICRTRQDYLIFLLSYGTIYMISFLSLYHIRVACMRMIIIPQLIILILAMKNLCSGTYEEGSRQNVSNL